MKWLKYGAAGIAGVIALAVIALYAMGLRADRGVLRTSIEINRPPDVVWTWLEDPAKFRQWVSWVTDVRDEGPSGPGGKRTVVMRAPNMNGQEVVVYSVLREYVPHRKMSVDLSSPLGFKGEATYTLTPLEGGRTRLEDTGRFEYEHWFARLLEPLVTPQAKAKLDADLATLKRLSEAN